MRRLACLAGCLALGWTALQGAEAGAAPRALLDAERAEDVALAGGEVVVAATTARGGARLTAVPVAGGPGRVRLTVPPPGRGWTAVPRLASSAQLTALLVAFIDPGGDFRDWRVYAGPPPAPLTLVQRVRRTSPGKIWTPIDLDVHADTLLIQELRQPDFAFRLVVRAPDVASPPVSQGRFGAPAALAGEQLAYLGLSGRADGRSFIRLVDWRTGRLSSSVEVGPHSWDMDDRHLDLAESGRVVAAIEGRLFAAAPGEPVHRLPGSGAADLTAPRFAGERVAAVARARLGAMRPVVIDPGAGTLRPVGPQSTSLGAIAADEATVAWLANGCVLAAGLDDAPFVGPPHQDVAPPGPCPRAEVVLDEHDQVLRGRTLRVVVGCVAGPPGGCRGAVVLGRGGRAGQGRFHVPAGERRVVGVRLSRRGMALTRRQLLRARDAFFRLDGRVVDGRVAGDAGTGGVVIDRVTTAPATAAAPAAP